jgi:hypothetical protein
MKTKTHFAFRVDIWDAAGDSILEHVAGIEDFEVAEATYRAAVARWPAARITLRQGARVVHDTGCLLTLIGEDLDCEARTRPRRPVSTTLADFERRGIPKSVFL